MRIAVDAYFNNNLGDDLFLDTLLRRYPNTNFDFLLKDLSACRAFQNNPRVNFVGRKHVFQNINKYDAYIFIGGSMFQEPIDWVKQWRILNLTVSIFKFFNKSTFILGCNFGPFKTNTYKNKYSKIFKKLTQITVRDNFSYEELKDKKINLNVYPDIVFSRSNMDKKNKNNNIVGISVIDWNSNNNVKDYLKFNSELISRLLIENKRIRLFSFQDMDKISDLKLIKQIIRKFESADENQIEVISYSGDLDTFLLKYSECGSMITSRFHSLVLSLLFKQKIIPIIYSEKTLNTLEYLGIEMDYFRMESITPKDVNKTLNIILNEENNYNINEIDKISEKAQNHFALLDQLLKE